MIKLKSNADNAIEELDDLRKAFDKIKNDSGSAIVRDSSFVTIENKINTDRLSDSEDEAIKESVYLEARQGEKVSPQDVESVSEKFIRDYLEELFK